MKRAAERAPIWVIAIMAHVALAGIFAVTYVRHEAVNTREPPSTVTEIAAPEVKLNDGLFVEIPREFRIPKVRDEPPTAEVVFGSPGDSTDRPPALEGGGLDPGAGAALPGEPGTLEPGLPGPVGLEGGSRHGGGSASRGLGGGLNPRLSRIDQAAGGSKAPQVVKGGLRWLREHQSDDGMWDCDGFHLRCDPKRGASCGGPGSAGHDVGVTGLALLAFFGAGHDGRRETPEDEAVRKGLKWLRSSQDALGCFGSQVDSRFTYSHACATIAMCEAATFNKKHEWRRSAQAAVRFIESCQNPRQGWRYGVRPGESDASVTGWMLLALKAGKDAGLEVSDRAMNDGLAYLDALSDLDDGRTGYQRRGEAPVRPEGFADRWPARESESLTAVALCARIFCSAPDYSGLTKAAAERLGRKLPVWSESTGSIDMYYWYYATLAMHQIGGPAWEQWNKSLEKAVIESQVKQGCAEGSWDPKDPWGAEGGRVYSTALMTLCFEVYWRYPLVFGGRK